MIEGDELYYLKNNNKKKYSTGGTVPKSNRKIEERGKIDIPKIQTHDREFSSLLKKWWG